MHKLAQVSHTLGTLQGGSEIKAAAGKNSPTQFANFITLLIGLLTIIASIWFIILVITGGISILSSGGDKGAFEGAKKRITTGVIGIAVVVVGLFLADFFANQLLGLQVLNVVSLFNSILPLTP